MPATPVSARPGPDAVDPAPPHRESRDDITERPGVTLVHTDAAELPVGVRDERPMSARAKILIALLAVLAAIGWAVLALSRGEGVDAAWFVVVALCSYAVAYRLYARLVESRIVRPDPARATPAEYADNGSDFVPTDRRVLYGHHFAAIAGAGPLVGPVLAAQMGYLPGIIWIVVGAMLAGCVQDYLVLWISTRRRGRSLGQMARDELGVVGGAAALVGTFVIMIIIVAILALVVVNALADSPWGVFSIAMTIPIALFMGVYLRFLRPGRVAEVSLIGLALLLLAIVSGGWVAETAWGADWFTLSKLTIAWLIVGYGMAASVLPVWLLLAPRDYLSTFMKIGVIVLLAAGILVAMPHTRMPAVTDFASSGTGPAFSGSLFPFLFITIACGALSGFHALIASGTTPKLVEKEGQMKMIGYGGMLTESFVAVMALTTAVVLDPHLYFAMNAPAALTGGTVEKAAAYVNGLGLGGGSVDPSLFTDTAAAVGEKTVVSRTGGAPTLAVGMSDVISRAFGGESLRGFWYHFAIMFEALFILTAVDAGTRVARFMLSDTVGNVPGLRRFKDPSWRVGVWVASAVCVALWGAILVMGVTDPLGGINTLFPLFGVANQLLAAIALTVVTVVVVKKGLVRWAWIPGLPLAFDLVTTMVASWQKVFSDNPSIGYWAQHRVFSEAADKGLPSFKSAKTPDEIQAVVFNTAVQGTLSVVFPVLVLVVVAAGAWVCVRSLRAGGSPTTEEPDVPSARFAPDGMIPTDVEREVERAWTCGRTRASV